jgi:hypothetical protein
VPRLNAWPKSARIGRRSWRPRNGAKARTGLDIPVHVDGASGGMIERGHLHASNPCSAVAATVMGFLRGPKYRGTGR